MNEFTNKKPTREESAGTFELQKLSFMRFIKKGPVDYGKVDQPVWFTISTLLILGCIKRVGNTLSYVKDYTTTPRGVLTVKMETA